MIWLWAASSWACGPDFPDRMLVDRRRILFELPDAAFLTEVRSLVPRPADPFVVNEARDPAVDPESVGLTAAQVAAVAAMRAQPTADAAWARGEGLPPDVRHYTAGAVAWHHDEVARAVAEWKAVLSLPERPLRGVWAAYMLGRAEVDPAYYAEARALARAGGNDAAGLAVSSLGQEARISSREGDIAGAVRLYAEQAAHGSSSGALSLLFVARSIGATDQWRAAAEDPLVRQLLVVWVWTRPQEAEASDVRWRMHDALPAAGPTRGADQIAAFAYHQGYYPLAREWAAHASTPLSTWVKAKLALQEGDTSEAARLYASLAEGWPKDTPGERLEVKFSRCRLDGERAGVALARGEYAEALGFLVDGAGVEGESPGWYEPPGWLDAAWVAERVLSADELRTFVDGPDFPAGADVGRRLRALLARRLVREGRAADAVAYFDDPEQKAAAGALADALGRTARGTPVKRARAHLEAAALIRPGLWLLGTEGPPDWAVYGGNYDPWGSWFGTPPPAEAPELQRIDEVARAQASSAVPAVRFHYRQVAADHALSAAALLPQTTQAYAVALCRAANYIRDRDPNQYASIYRRYVQTGPLYEGSGGFGSACPEPDWAGAARAGSPLASPSARWVFGALPLLVFAVFGTLATLRMRRRL